MSGRSAALEGKLLVDLVLAIAHHLFVFSLAGVLAAEFALVRPGLAGRELRLVARIDQLFGVLALGIVIIGVLRIFFGLKGWEFYIYNWAFWAKMAAFLAVGLLSIKPTVRIIAWRSAATRSTGLYVAPDREISEVRRLIRWEVGVFLLIPVFAATMARGIAM